MYRFETKEYTDGLFSVDAAYVIHLENNGRFPQLTRELEARHPANVVHILFNPGYKKMAKELPQQSPAHDLVHAYKHVFKDAREKGYDRVLVLEDDFMFRKDLKSSDVAQVNSYLEAHTNRRMMYQLGCIPGLMVPVGGSTFLTVACGTHACVYTQKLRDHVLEHKGYIRDWDFFMTFHSLRFAYSIPLCYQLYPATDNSDHWMPLLGYTSFLKRLIQLVGLDKRAEPAFSICYWGAKMNFYLMIALVALVVYFRKAILSLNSEKIYSYSKWFLQKLHLLRNKATPTLPL